MALSRCAPATRGGHPPKFTLGERRQATRVALSLPVDRCSAFSTWSLAKLADGECSYSEERGSSVSGLQVLKEPTPVALHHGRVATVREATNLSHDDLLRLLFGPDETFR
jgi:hypothetical protein